MLTGTSSSPPGYDAVPAADTASVAWSAVLPAAAGGVATWLPEGRWLTAAGDDDGSGSGRARAGGGRRAGTDPGDADRIGDEGGRAARSRSRRRVAIAKVAARLAGWPRRALAAALLVTAVLVALRPASSPAGVTPPLGVPVVVVAKDLPAGATLSAADLRTVALPIGVVPAGTVREVGTLLGRIVAGPVRRGEPVTDARLVGPGLTAGLGPRESSAVPVRLADPETAALVRTGDRVDVLGTPIGTVGVDGEAVAGTPAVEVATGVRVLAVLRGSEEADGVVLVVAAAPAAARRLTGAAARHRLTVTVRPP